MGGEEIDWMNYNDGMNVWTDGLIRMENLVYVSVSASVSVSHTQIYGTWKLMKDARAEMYSE